MSTLFHAHFNDTLGADIVGAGSVEPLSVGGLAIAREGFLNFSDNPTTSSIVFYDPTNINGLGNQSCFRFNLVPDFGGTNPSVDMNLIQIKQTSTANNYLRIRFETDGIKIFMNDSNGNIILNSANIGNLAAVSGTAMELEFNIDTDAGRLFGFKGGNTLGSLSFTPFKVVMDNDLFVVGNTFPVADASDYKIDYLTIFDVVKHSSAYTALPSEPTKCVVTGFLTDIVGRPIDTTNTEAKMIVENKSFEHENYVIPAKKRIFLFDPDGRIETKKGFLETPDADADDGLIESSSVSVAAYTISIQYKDGLQEKQFRYTDVVMPNTTAATLISLGDI